MQGVFLMSKINFKSLVFSNFLKDKSHAQKVAFLGLFTAINVVFNSFFEFKMLDVQFSFTILISALTGIITGPLSGFFSCVLADFIGYIINSAGLTYMPWVGLSTGVLALCSGLIFIKGSDKILLKSVLVCVCSLFLCTILINSTGFYFYNKAMGFSTAVLNYVNEFFNSDVSYIAYVCYRLIFKMQILVSIFNFILIIITIPVLKKLKIIL